MRKTLIFSLLTLLGFTLSACQYLQNSDDNREARCKEIKSRMMFNGNTNLQTQAFQERMDQPKLNQSYHEEDC